MVQKRHFRDHEGDGRDSKRKPLWRTVVDDLARTPSLTEAVLEPLIRRVVREEVEKALSRRFNASPCHSAHQAGPSGGRSGLELRFVNNVRQTIFTGSKIEPEDTSLVLQIVLFDTVSQTVVQTGPLSSVKVEIVALDGDFGADENEDWTERQFNDSVLRARDGRRPLVTGELTVTLCDGVGFLTNVVFTDNSSWVRSRKFRLGVRIAQRIPGEVRVREARSWPFVVKDHRGELYKKHHPPHLRDEVWRLEKIAKDGAFHKRLAASGISTVAEFLRCCARDPSALREILGAVSDRNWNAIVDHAKNCVVDDNTFFAYHRADLNVSVVFNSIHKPVGAFFNEQCLPIEALAPSQKILVENLKQVAYRNVNDLVAVDWLSIAGPSRPIAEPYNDPSIDLQQHGFPVVHQDQPPEVSHQLVVPAAQQLNTHQLALPQTNRTPSFSFEDFILPANFTGEPGWSTASSSQMPFLQTNHFSPENLLNFQGTSFPSTTWSEPGTSFFFASNNNEAAEAGLFPGIPGFVHMSRDTKGKAWSKVRTAFKCLLLVKHAARKMPHAPFYLSY